MRRRFYALLFLAFSQCTPLPAQETISISKDKLMQLDTILTELSALNESLKKDCQTLSLSLTISDQKISSLQGLTVGYEQKIAMLYAQLTDSQMASDEVQHSLMMLQSSYEAYKRASKKAILRSRIISVCSMSFGGVCLFLALKR